MHHSLDKCSAAEIMDAIRYQNLTDSNGKAMGDLGNSNTRGQEKPHENDNGFPAG